MIIPSIDLQNQSTVQLVGGEDKALDAGDPRPIARRFGVAGEIAVIDLDAAMGTGNNRALITDLLPIADCRVGGGIRDLDTAMNWLDAGAAKVILGTMAVPEILKHLPKERVIAALDAKHGEVVVEGWKKATGRGIIERIAELREYVGGFLITFVEREGRLGGTNLDQVEALIKAAGDAKVTIAGGVTTAEDIRALDQMGADAQVGMAIYTGRLNLVDAIVAPLGEGPWPAIFVDERSSVTGFSSIDRDRLIEISENARSIRLSVERDALCISVEGERSFGDLRGLAQLSKVLLERTRSAPAGSYTRRLIEDPDLLRSKLVEEANELADAKEAGHVAEEAADVIYFALVAAARAGVDLDMIERVLDRRALRVTRRKGDAKVKP